MREIAWIVSVSCLLVTLVGCSPAGDQEPSQSRGDSNATGAVKAKGIVGVSVMTLTNPFFMVVAKNLEKELAPHGYTIELHSAENDAAKQQNQVKDFIVKKCAAIVLNPTDSKAIGAAIVEANHAGIPVFTVDIRCLDPTARVVAHVGTDNYGGGKLAGKALIEAVGDSGGKVVLLDHEVVESTIERAKGFKEVLEAHNRSGKGGKLELVAELPCGGARDVGFRSTEDAIQSHPDIVGLFAVNDPAALGARAALEKAGKADQVKIIGFDGQPEGKKAIKDGKIYADPIQYPDKMGLETGRAIIKYFNGDEVRPRLDIPTSLYRQADAEKDPEINDGPG